MDSDSVMTVKDTHENVFCHFLVFETQISTQNTQCLLSIVFTWHKRRLPVRTPHLLMSSPSVADKWAHGSCINHQHGDPRLSPDALPPVIRLLESCHYASASSRSPLHKFETAPLCVTNFYIQQRSRDGGWSTVGGWEPVFTPSVS